MSSATNELQEELRDILGRFAIAHRRGDRRVASAFAKCAEELLCVGYPAAANAISLAAARKGGGVVLSRQIVPHIDPAGAALAMIVLMFRGARQPVVRAISEQFVGDADFEAAQRRLCDRIFAA